MSTPVDMRRSYHPSGSSYWPCPPLAAIAGLSGVCPPVLSSPRLQARQLWCYVPVRPA